MLTPTRRSALAGLAASILPSAQFGAFASTASSVSFGLNPLFLDSDLELLSMIENYLSGKLGRSVQLVRRRTYQEITAMLLSGQLDGAWVCDDPYVQHEDQLSLLAVPLYRQEPLYQTYVLVNENSTAQSFDEIRGTVHAFSDPDSTSGFLVTRYLLALRHATPATFFREFFFAYGHRNVVRAVASGLAGSGSIDGYVWLATPQSQRGFRRRFLVCIKTRSAKRSLRT
jgi:phosphonate transport system substrate-binding protein